MTSGPLNNSDLLVLIPRDNEGRPVTKRLKDIYLILRGETLSSSFIEFYHKEILEARRLLDRRAAHMKGERRGKPSDKARRFADAGDGV